MLWAAAHGNSEAARSLLALNLIGILFALTRRSTSVGVSAIVAYLALMGGLRRWIIPAYDWSPTDPLLVVVPILAVFLLLTTRRNYSYTPLMRALIGLLLFMAVEIVNPLQGGLAVGVGGAVFYIAPLLWYFLGRQVGSQALIQKMARAVVGIAIAAALYGLYQTFFGLNEGEQMWMQITSSSYSALRINGVFRAFSFFTSSQEYALFLALGVVVLWAMFIHGLRVALLPILLLATALFLESSRTPVVLSLVTGTILWAVQGRTVRSWAPRRLISPFHDRGRTVLEFTPGARCPL